MTERQLIEDHGKPDGDVRPGNRLPFVSLLIANTISLTGSYLTLVAIPWYVLLTTGSPAKTGLAGTANIVGYVLGGVLGGAAVDRLGFKRTSLLGDAASGVSIALIPLLAETVGLGIWPLLLLVFLATFCSVPGINGRESLLPDLAHQARMPLERVNSLYHAAPRLAQLIGPPVAGVLIAVLGARNLLWLDAASFGASVVIIGIAIPGTKAFGSQGNSQPALSLRRYVAEIVGGLRLLRRDALLLAMVVNNGAGNLIGAALSGVILPVYARDVFGSALDLGLLFSAYGAGALIGSIGYGVVGQRIPRRAAYTVSWVLDSVPFWLLVIEPGLVPAMIILIVWGIVGSPNLPLTYTIAQERVPEDQLGRFFGTRAALANAASPLGILLMGYLIQASGLRIGLMVMAALSMTIALNVVANPAFHGMTIPAAESER